MIGRLTGILAAKQPPLLLLDVNGVGYEVEAPMTVFYDLPEVGGQVTLITHMAVKDDAHSLYGFLREADRSLFRSLLKISGIGAKSALTILSGVNPSQLSTLVAEGNAAALTQLPGIGKKTAERLIVELRDKLGDIPTAGVTPVSPGGGIPLDAQGEAAQALVSLGYKLQEATRMVKTVAKDKMDVEEMIRLALQSKVKS